MGAATDSTGRAKRGLAVPNLLDASHGWIARAAEEGLEAEACGACHVIASCVSSAIHPLGVVRCASATCSGANRCATKFLISAATPSPAAALSENHM